VSESGSRHGKIKAPHGWGEDIHHQRRRMAGACTELSNLIAAAESVCPGDSRILPQETILRSSAG